MTKHDIENIISKQIIEGLSNQEQLILNDWLSESEENKKVYESYSKLWNKSKNLVVSDAIDVDASLLQTKRRIGFHSKKRWITYSRQAAAVLLLSLCLSFFYQYISKTNNIETSQQEVYQTVKASYGSQTKVVLADSTIVWLNSGSSLEFPFSFNNADKREVNLNGEGYFEVSKDESKPFVVKTSKLDVKVYGTSFNVHAYDNYDLMTVALVEGAVSLVDCNGSQQDEVIAMKPNEVVEYNDVRKTIKPWNEHYMEKHIAWKDGYLIFYGDPIDVLVRRLEKWYNVKIVVADSELKNYRFTATFIDESLDHVLKLLSLSSPLQYKIIPSKKLSDNSYSVRSITLSIKK